MRSKGGTGGTVGVGGTVAATVVLVPEASAMAPVGVRVAGACAVIVVAPVGPTGVAVTVGSAGVAVTVGPASVAGGGVPVASCLAAIVAGAV